MTEHKSCRPLWRDAGGVSRTRSSAGFTAALSKTHDTYCPPTQHCCRGVQQQSRAPLCSTVRVATSGKMCAQEGTDWCMASGELQSLRSALASSRTRAANSRIRLHNEHANARRNSHQTHGRPRPSGCVVYASRTPSAAFPDRVRSTEFSSFRGS
jgi:hypothetical protein